MLTSYYYNKQIKQYILQTANIFTGLIVKTGKGADGNITEIEVPVVYSSKDRVVASIGSGNTQNRLHTLPLLSIFLTNIELAPERRKGTGTVDRQRFLPQGGLFPNDLQVAYRLMPIPYNLQFDIGIYASNTDQAFQILEQLLILFDPTIQLQTSDKPLDFTKITHAELLSLNNEENMPSGTDKRMIIWTLGIVVAAWLAPPMDIKNNIVQKIILRMGDLAQFTLYEYDEHGEPQAFMEGPWFDEIITSPMTEADINEPAPEDKI
jgi:hypothetical protein